MKPLLSIFLSSRNNDCFVIDGMVYDSLTTVRLSLQKNLESQLLLGERFLSVRINESFATDTSEDSYKTCITETQKADLVIVLYNGSAGWAPPGVTMGICHAELEAALLVSNKKTAIIDISDYFELTTIDPIEIKRNKAFQDYVKMLNKFINPLKLTPKKRNKDGFIESLTNSIKAIITNHLAKRVEHSNHYYALSKTNTVALSWKKMKYDDRAKAIENVLSELVDSSPYFADCFTKSHPVPDKMSIDEARKFTGRPFLYDQDEILLKKKGKASKLLAGPIHFIGVYETATEGQVKSIVGYPDISVIKEDFGYYLWEQNTHIQLVFLTECYTPDAIRTKYILFENWANSTSELERMLSRAKARYHILASINQAKLIAVAK